MPHHSWTIRLIKQVCLLIPLVLGLKKEQVLTKVQLSDAFILSPKYGNPLLVFTLHPPNRIPLYSTTLHLEADLGHGLKFIMHEWFFTAMFIIVGSIWIGFEVLLLVYFLNSRKEASEIERYSQVFDKGKKHASDENGYFDIPEIASLFEERLS